ncbi:DUF3459 domain-containing protein [Lentzea alba]|uniref:glycogen debranching protein n=1 Tax=Lentzea alba TaxID=2714351 RepID=UPI0039BF7D99
MTAELTGLRVVPAAPEPLGAHAVPGGVTFAVRSAGATDVALVLYRTGAAEPFAEVPFPPECRTGGVYAMTVRGLDPDGIEYGYRVWGPDGPGDRFDPGRVVADPHARAVGGGGQRWGEQRQPFEGFRYRSRVVADDFDWQGDRPLRLPVEDLVVYELHVRGFTRHRSSGVASPGTFAGLADKVDHLVELGVNCVELLPVFEFDELANDRYDPVTGQPLWNYWGYSTVGYFAPKQGYACGDAARELKSTVRALHAAGIQVVLDVVFNHTAEGNDNGPAISLRGLDNQVYYLLDEHGGYRNYSGTGNTVNANHPQVVEFVLDCLRYWVTEFHVDGFRFDLAAALTRGEDGTPLADPPLLRAISTDPLLRDTLLIAEAWDAAGLYQVGSFPGYDRWSEWNGAFRDTVRRFVKGDEDVGPDLVCRLTGSPDLFPGRGPLASLNFVTAHDGFTLADLFSYNDKHNERNGEHNADGETHNHSWNCGHEGPTTDQEVLALRRKLTRFALTLLLLARGVPMLVAGDEFGRTQQGNNNAYCHDDELSWVDWDLASRNRDLVEFTAALIAFRRAHPALRSGTFDGVTSSLSGRVAGLTFEVPGDAVFLAANAHWEPAWTPVPAAPDGMEWRLFADTSGSRAGVEDRITLEPRSAVVLEAVPKGETGR